MKELADFPVLRIRAVWAAEEQLSLRGYPGNMFRGALGKALRHAVCAEPRRDCSGCAENQSCAWVRLFRTSSLHAHLSQGERATPPSPLVIEPPRAVGECSAGDELCIELVVIGDAAMEVASIAAACERMGELGIGDRRSHLRLLHVDFVCNRGYAVAYVPGCLQHTKPSFEPNLSALAAQAPAGRGRRWLTVRLLTPLRLRSSGELRVEVSFPELVRAAHWRAQQLGELYAPDVCLPLREDVMAIAERCEVVGRSLQWEDWDVEWSNWGRCPAGGLVGHLSVGGDWRPLLPLLCLAEQVHVGNGATYGLGKIALV